MPRKERDGKKTKKSKELSEAVARGKHEPKTAPKSKASIERALKIVEAVQAESSGSTAVASEVRSVPKSIETGNRSVETASASSSTAHGAPEFVSVAVEEPEFPDFVSSTGKGAVPAKPLLSSPIPQFLGKPEPPKSLPVVQSPKSSSVLAPRERVSSGTSSVVVPFPTKKRAAESSNPPEAFGKARSTVGERPSFPGTPPLAKSLGVEAAIQECRISVDYNHVLNLEYAGDRESPGIHPANVRLLKEFIRNHKDRGVRIGVTSYIGTQGWYSQDRRNHLNQEIAEFNRSETDPKAKLGVCIVDTRQKGLFLNTTGCAIHIDDKLECLDSCHPSITTFWVSKAKRHHRHHIVSSLREALEQIEQGRFQAILQARPFENCWAVR